MGKLRIAVWGSGNMAHKHVQSAVTDGRCELVGIAARNVDAAERIRTTFGSEECIIRQDPLALIADTECDAFICAIPPGLQQNQAAELAARGKHLFLEKPVALTLDHVQAIASAAEKAFIQSQVCHHMRFDPGIAFLKQALDTGQAGRACLYESRFWMNGDMSAWWKSKHLGGGQVIEQLIHQFDLARHLFGPVKQLSGFWARLVQSHDPSYEVDDNSVCNLQFENGALGHINGSNCATPNRWIADWRMVCEHLNLEAHHDGHWDTPFKSQIRYVTDDGDVRQTFERTTDLHKACLDNWLDAIDGKDTCRIPISDAVETHKLVFAAAESMQNNGALATL